MTTTALMPVEDYIKAYIDSGTKPACEYVDGFLIPKGMGNRKHSRIQRRLLELLRAYSNFEAFPELHARVRETEFRIPDIVIERKPVTEDYYPTKPVHLCIEIISPDLVLEERAQRSRAIRAAQRLCEHPAVRRRGIRALCAVGQMLEKCEHYHRWGTPYCWVIDPEKQTAWEYHRGDEPKRLQASMEALSAGEIRLKDFFCADRVNLTSRSCK